MSVAITWATCHIMMTLTRSDVTVAATVASYCLLLSGILRLTIPIASTRVKREMWRMPRQIPHVRFSSLQHLLPSPPLSFLSVGLRLGILPLDSPWGTTNLTGLHHGKRVLARQRRTSPKFNGRSTPGENDLVGHRYYG